MANLPPNPHMAKMSPSGIKIENEKKVTAADISNEAAEIWRECKRFRAKTPYTIDDNASHEQLLTDIRRKHKDFSTSYPIVIRYMAQMNLYNSAAFKKYLAKIAIKPWKSTEEYLDSQADYVVLLYKETNKKWTAQQVNNIKINVRKMLGLEHKQFLDNHAKCAEIVEENEERFNKISKNELAEYFRKIAAIDKYADSGQITNNIDTVNTTDNSNVNNSIIDNIIDDELANDEELTIDKFNKSLSDLIEKVNINN